MSALPRLLDDPGISEQLRADLRRTQLHAVAPFDTAAGLARLRTGLKGAGNPTTPPATGGALPGSTWKLFAALGVAGVVGWVLLSGNRSHETTPQVTTARGPAVVTLEQEPTPSSRAKSGAAAVTPLGETDERAVAVPDATIRPASQPETSVAQPTASPEKSDPFAEEIAQLASLRQLHRTDPLAAISLARAGHKKFPQGMLYEEREALLILSLGDAGQMPEAQRRAVDFRNRFPTSAFLSKLDRMSPPPQEAPGAVP